MGPSRAAADCARVLLLLLCLTGAARAWGPSTHAALALDLLERIRSRPGSVLSFLTHPETSKAFVGASLGPDMTANLFTAGKSDAAYNGLLHNPRMARAMARTAAARHDPVALAFALGWLGHIEADRVMAQPGGVVYMDLCGVPDPAGRSLAAARTAMVKFAVDTVLVEQRHLAQTEPYIDQALLVPALDAALAGRRWPRDPPAVAIPSFARSFSLACTALYLLERASASNTKAYPGMEAALARLAASEDADDDDDDGSDPSDGAKTPRRDAAQSLDTPAAGKDGADSTPPPQDVHGRTAGDLSGGSLGGSPGGSQPPSPERARSIDIPRLTRSLDAMEALLADVAASATATVQASPSARAASFARARPAATHLTADDPHAGAQADSASRTRGATDGDVATGAPGTGAAATGAAIASPGASSRPGASDDLRAMGQARETGRPTGPSQDPPSPTTPAGMPAETPAGMPAGTPAGTSPGLLDRAWTAGGYLLAQGARFLWSHEMTRHLGQSSVERALTLIDGTGVPLSPSRRVVITFVAAMADGVRTWPEVQARVRRVGASAMARGPGSPTRAH